MVKLTESRGKLVATKKSKSEKAPRQAFDLKHFIKSFQSLDQNNYGSWPTPVKATVLTAMVLLIGALAYAVPISGKMDEIKMAENEENTLLGQYKIKESKAHHLKEYQAQIAQMSLDFKELLNQLPKETRISDLVDGINMVGNTSKIRFQDISVEPEVSKEFFIEQPIRIAAVGDYDKFGSFMSGLAKLPRIITLHDFEVNNSKPTLDQLPELTLKLNAKTYRYKDIKPEELKKSTASVSGSISTSAPASTEAKK